MFVGNYARTFDEKGRLVLPSAYRANLTETGVVTQWDQCLAVWTPEGFDEVAARLTERIRSGEADQYALRGLSANAHAVKPDAQGRIVIPPRLRDYAGLSSQVTVVGAISRIEIWDTTRWEELEARADQSLAQAVNDLGL